MFMSIFKGLPQTRAFFKTMPARPEPVKRCRSYKRRVMFYHLRYNQEQLPSTSPGIYGSDGEASLPRRGRGGAEVSAAKSFENVASEFGSVEEYIYSG